MARPTDPRKSLAWQRRLQQFTASGMTVSKFCDREGVSVATFQYWRQRLAPQQSEQVSRLVALRPVSTGQLWHGHPPHEGYRKRRNRATRSP